MVNIWDRDYIGNPNNRFYVSSAGMIGMEWKYFREMYDKLDEEPKKELNIFLRRLQSIEIQEYIESIGNFENQSSELRQIKYNSLATA